MDTKGMDTLNKNTDPVGLLPKVFSGEASPEEKSFVDAWVEADPANHAEFESFARLWNITSSAPVQDEINLDAEWQKMNSAISPARRTISMVRLLQIAASVIFVSALAFVGLKLTGPVSEKAPVAGISTDYLPDGTKVTLNAGSKIAYKKGFGESHRNLVLKGEAYFEVMKGDVPFVITAGEASIRVTGTKFNVKAYSDKPVIRITVTEGTVVLFETGLTQKEVRLKTGETGIYDKSLHAVKKQSASDWNDLAWKTRIMDFKDTPLNEVAEILANTYHIPVEVDKILKNCSVTVHFENQELESVILVLKSTLDLTITRKGRHISITGKGC